MMKKRGGRTVALGRWTALACAALAALTCAASSLAARETISEVRRGAFIIRADFDLTSLSDKLALLDALNVEMRAALRLPEFRENVVVRVFRNEAAWREFQRKNMGGAPYRRAMYDRKNYLFDRDDAPGRVYLCLNPEFDKDLRHEGAHAILGAAFGRGLPIWLDEGIAEYFEAAPEERLTNPVWRAQTVERLRRGKFSTLESLEKIVGIEGMTVAKYGDSWAWVCWFLNGPEAAREAFRQYLGDAGAGKLFAPKASKRLKGIAKDGGADASLRRFFLAE
ncbi:MAG: hypothetical protein IKW13_01390 [Thermoguttaceae bacterium]|nr:hypothetical protein [Thermoguttaceae bacterium]